MSKLVLHMSGFIRHVNSVADVGILQKTRKIQVFNALKV